jgi:translocation and assembly module TamB
MRRASKVVAWSTVAVVALIIILVGTVLIVGNTDRGRLLITNTTAQLTDGKVRLTGLHGSFPAALDLDRLELHDANGPWLWADKISLRWTPSALLTRHIDVARLHVARLHIERAPAPDDEPKPKSNSSTSLPRTDLRDLSVDALELGPALAGAPASFVVKGTVHAKSLNDADAHITARRTAGDGNYDVQAHFDTKSTVATVKLDEPANGPLASLLKIPNVGALSVLAQINGPHAAERVQLDLKAGPLQASAQGTVDIDRRRADLDVALTAPAMKPIEGFAWKAVDVHGSVRGPWATPTAEARVLVSSLETPGGTQLKTLDAHLNANGMVLRVEAGIDGLKIPGKAPEVFANSRVNLNGFVRLNDPQRPVELTVAHRLFSLQAKAVTASDQRADVNLQIPDLRPLAPLTGANVEGDARIQAHLARNRSTMQLTAQLDGAPLAVEAAVEPAGTGYHARIARADWKSAHAEAEVTTGKTIAEARGTGRFGMSDLSDLNRLVGSALSGAVNGEFALESQSGQPHARLDLQAQQVTVGGVTTNATVRADGPLDALHASLVADSPAVGGQPVHLDLSALLNATKQELRLVSLQTSYSHQDVKLVQPSTLSFSNGVEVHHLKLGVQTATIELDGKLSPTLDARANVRNVTAALVNSFVPDLLASGTLSADATLQGTPAAPTGQVHVQALGVKAKNEATQGLPAADLRATARLNGERADIEMRLTAGNNSHVTLTGQAPLTPAGSLALKLAGTLDVALVNPLIEASGRHATGTIDVNTAIAGTVAAPEITGSMRLSKGSVRDYSNGIALSDITGTITGDHGTLRVKELTARAPPGRLSIEGTIGVLQPKIPVDLKLTAKDAQPIASNIVTANLDAQMRVTGTAREHLEVSGNVHLNRANVAIPGAMPPNVVVLDVERPGAPPPAAVEHPLVIDLRLAVDAPRRILVTGRGLDAEMGGALTIRGTTAAPVIEGGFELQRGSFTLANSKLTFTEGRVTFNGTGLQQKLDPSLDFTAQNQAAEVTAIVHITGLADAPKIELTSTPELPQDEILARLLFGEPAAQLSGLQLLQTGAALASLRGGTGSSLNPLNKIQKALGLDRLSVGGGGPSGSSTASNSASESSGASVQAGRYVSDRVYVGVKESTTGASQVQVEVDLTKRLKAQAKLGNGSTTAQGVTPENDPGSSIGLAYQFEY